MNLQRLKFAHARGARIQVPEGACRWQGDRNVGAWVSVGHPFWTGHQAYRIHPDDANLEYGPVSRELRRMAIEDTWKGCQFDTATGVLKLPAWIGIWVYIDGYQVSSYTMDDLRTYLLILAEWLADEGL